MLGQSLWGVWLGAISRSKSGDSAFPFGGILVGGGGVPLGKGNSTVCHCVCGFRDLQGRSNYISHSPTPSTGDAIALLPIHHGCVPSQPDPSGWAALPPYEALQDTELAPEAVRSRASSEPEPYRAVTVESVADYLAQDPTVSDLIKHLGLPQEVDDALQVLLLRDVPTLLAALSNITEVLGALVENGATTTMRPLQSDQLQRPILRLSLAADLP